jgi:hypothetical protein
MRSEALRGEVEQPAHMLPPIAAPRPCSARVRLALDRTVPFLTQANRAFFEQFGGMLFFNTNP